MDYPSLQQAVEQPDAFFALDHSALRQRFADSRRITPINRHKARTKGDGGKNVSPSARSSINHQVGVSSPFREAT